MISRRALILLCFIATTILLFSCSDDEEPGTEPSEVTDQVNDVASLSSLFLRFDGVLSTDADLNNFYINSNGIANHKMMVGITITNDQIVIPHDYESWTIPLRPEFSDDEVLLDTNFKDKAVAIAINGVPIFNPLDPIDLGELDEFGGHVGTEDNYHYHTAPLHLQTDANNPIAYAFDGFPIYGSNEPDGSDMEMLDEFNGHIDGNDEFHYHAIENPPFLFEKFRGKVAVIGTPPDSEVQFQPSATALRSEEQVRVFLSQYSQSGEAVITDFIQNENEMGYSMIYEVNGIEGSVTYFWDVEGFYTFEFNDPDGTFFTQIFERN